MGEERGREAQRGPEREEGREKEARGSEGKGRGL